MGSRLLLFFFLIVSFGLNAQNDSLVILRDSLWKYIEGDNPKYADPEFDDSKWDSTVTIMIVNKESKPSIESIIWFRKKFTVPKELRNSIVAFAMNQSGASQIYLDGKLVKEYGKVALNPEDEIAFNPNYMPLPVMLDEKEEHVIAIRYSDQTTYKNLTDNNSDQSGFVLKVGAFEAIAEEYLSQTILQTWIRVFLGTLFGSLAFLHFVLFLFYRKKKNNLFYSILMFCSSVFVFIPEFAMSTNNPENSKIMMSAMRFVIPFFLGAFHALLYSLFYKKMPKFMFFMLGAMLLVIIMLIFKLPFVGVLAILLSFTVFIDSFRVCLVAIIKRKKGAWIVGGGVLFLLITILSMIILGIASGGSGLYLSGDSLGEILFIAMIILAVMSLPLSMTVYLAWDISNTNKELSKQLIQVQDLSEKTIQQEKEKKKILESQKEKLEIEVAERTKEIQNQKDQLEEKNTEIMDSITYAKRIQSAILPSDKLIKEHLPNSFVLYKPKDIVAGDFYWMVSFADSYAKASGSEKASASEGILIAAADCTGHGVPGAMVSVVCNNGLNRSVREYGLSKPGEILDKTRELVIEEFEKSEQEVKDGMDIAIVTIVQSELESESEVGNPRSHTSHSLSYSGANNPLWIIKKDSSEIEEIKAEFCAETSDRINVYSKDDYTIIEVKADKQPIGKFDNPKPFTTHEIELNSGDAIYFFSDGYADQFGGEKGKKLKSRNFKNLLLSIQEKSMEEQKHHLDEFFEKWRGEHEQVDDVCVIGIRV